MKYCAMVVAIFLAIFSNTGCATLASKHNVNKSSAAAAAPKSEPPKSKEPEKRRYDLIDISDIPEKELLTKVIKACPMILTEKKRGTGFLFSNDGWILTDLHVVGTFDTVKVIFFAMTDEDDNFIEETLTVTGKVIAWSKDTNKADDKDLALIKIDTVPPGVEPLELGTNDMLKMAQPLWRFGYSDGYRWAYGFFTPNRNSAPRAEIAMPVAGGTSGGPAIAMDGRVVGIVQRGIDGHDETIDRDGVRKSIFEFPTVNFLPIDEINLFLSTVLPKKN